MVNPIPKSQEGNAYSEQTSPRKAKAWKWEKKHWLIMIAASCLVLFWFGSQLTETSWIRTSIDWLPVIGTVAFAAEKIIKLTQ